MKRLLACLLCAVLLCSFSARAEELPEYEADPLFPAREDASGLWGYIDRTGAWRIAPQFDGAGDFRGNYAPAWLAPQDPAPDSSPSDFDEDCTGIIDRTGAWVVPPEYSLEAGYSGGYYGGRDTGIWYVDRYKSELVGFFDIPNGYFSGLRWYDVWSWCSDSDLIAVTDKDFRVGYVSRSTGEQVIPCMYYGHYPSNFYEGVATVAYTDEEGWPIDDNFFLMDEQGNIIPLPEGISVCDFSSASQGRIAIQDQVTKLYGFADLQGHVVIAPQYEDVSDFSEGYAAVRFPEGDKGYVDLAGNVLARGFEKADSFENGSAKVILNGETVYIGYDGQVKPGAEGKYRFMDNGLAWVLLHPEQTPWSQENGYYLIDQTGARVSSEAYWLVELMEHDFPEGMQVVQSLTDQKYLFLNSKGQEAFSTRFDDADNFHHGLARVRVGDTCGYIDMEGNWGYTWQQPKGGNTR